MIRGGASPLDEAYTRLTRHLGTATDKVLTGSRWKLRALLVVVSLALFRAFPAYDALSTEYVEWKWRCAQIKFDDPLADMGRIFPAGSHESQLTFRLAAPLLANTFQLRRTGMLIFFALTGILLLHLFLHLAYEASGSRRVALFVCLALAAVWPGAAAFHELRGGYYDALALCLVTLAFSARSRAIAIVLVFAAAWTDERAIPASAFLLLYPPAGSRAGAVLVAWTAYFGLREYLAATHSYSAAASGVGFPVLLGQVNIIPLGAWSGLGGAWLLVLLALLLLFFQERYMAALGFSAVLAACAGGALLVVDVTRSMAYCLPAVFVALSVLSRGEAPERLERLTAIAAGISYLLPTHYVEGAAGVWWLYPLPVQIGRWLTRSWT